MRSAPVSAALLFLAFNTSASANDSTRAVVDRFNEAINRHGARFEAEEVIVSADRCVTRWVYRKMRDGRSWHLRGVDVLTVRDGKIAAKLAYVKG